MTELAFASDIRYRLGDIFAKSIAPLIGSEMIEHPYRDIFLMALVFETLFLF